jgi:hypothetical protein
LTEGVPRRNVLRVIGGAAISGASVCDWYTNRQNDQEIHTAVFTELQQEGIGVPTDQEYARARALVTGRYREDIRNTLWSRPKDLQKAEEVITARQHTING